MSFYKSFLLDFGGYKGKESVIEDDMCHSVLLSLYTDKDISKIDHVINISTYFWKHVNVKNNDFYIKFLDMFILFIMYLDIFLFK